jgi:anti-sigma regulatory factor (Ser/Thr protein kinase)
MERKFHRNFNELGKIVAFSDEFFASQPVDPSLRNIVELCVEELFVNLVTYNRETSADILISLETNGGGVRVSLTDYNVERFDPRSAPLPDIEAPLEERMTGGLGLYLVMKMADAIHYEYHDRTSKITFVKNGNTHDV